MTNLEDQFSKPINLSKEIILFSNTDQWELREVFPFNHLLFCHPSDSVKGECWIIIGIIVFGSEPENPKENMFVLVLKEKQNQLPTAV